MLFVIDKTSDGEIFILDSNDGVVESVRDYHLEELHRKGVEVHGVTWIGMDYSVSLAGLGALYEHGVPRWMWLPYCSSVEDARGLSINGFYKMLKHNAIHSPVGLNKGIHEFCMVEKPNLETVSIGISHEKDDEYGEHYYINFFVDGEYVDGGTLSKEMSTQDDKSVFKALYLSWIKLLK